MSGFLELLGTAFITISKAILVLGFIFFLLLRWLFGPVYDTRDLIKNFERRESEIQEAKNYFTSILPPDTYVDIEFSGKHPDIFHVRLPGQQLNSNWNLKLGSGKTDTLLHQLGWTNETLYRLRKKLKKANCISISGKNPVTVGWQRSLMSKYYYLLFDQDLSPDQISQYNDGCIYQVYNSKVVLEYGSGALGSMCFPEFQ